MFVVVWLRMRLLLFCLMGCELNALSLVLWLLYLEVVWVLFVLIFVCYFIHSLQFCHMLQQLDLPLLLFQLSLQSNGLELQFSHHELIQSLHEPGVGLRENSLKDRICTDHKSSFLILI